MACVAVEAWGEPGGGSAENGRGIGGGEGATRRWGEGGDAGVLCAWWSLWSLAWVEASSERERAGDGREGHARPGHAFFPAACLPQQLVENARPSRVSRLNERPHTHLHVLGHLPLLRARRLLFLSPPPLAPSPPATISSLPSQLPSPPSLLSPSEWIQFSSFRSFPSRSRPTRPPGAVPSGLWSPTRPSRASFSPSSPSSRARSRLLWRSASLRGSTSRTPSRSLGERCVSPLSSPPSLPPPLPRSFTFDHVSLTHFVSFSRHLRSVDPGDRAVGSLAPGPGNDQAAARSRHDLAFDPPARSAPGAGELVAVWL
jgi:hypothetical protein